MKKLFSVLAVLFVMGTANIFALGIGAQAGYTVGGNPGGALTFKLDTSPIVFAVDGTFSNSYFSVGVTGDYWLANPKIDRMWGYYYGVGAAAGFACSNNNWMAVDLAPRAVVGTNIFVLDRFLEFYLQGAWQPTFRVYVGNTSGVDYNLVSFPVNLGFRFWF